MPGRPTIVSGRRECLLGRGWGVSEVLRICFFLGSIRYPPSFPLCLVVPIESPSVLLLLFLCSDPSICFLLISCWGHDYTCKRLTDSHVTLEINLSRPQLSKKPHVRCEIVFPIWQGAAPWNLNSMLSNKTWAVVYQLTFQSGWGKHHKPSPMSR